MPCSPPELVPPLFDQSYAPTSRSILKTELLDIACSDIAYNVCLAAMLCAVCIPVFSYFSYGLELTVDRSYVNEGE